MTGVIRWNKSKTPAGADGWNLTTDIGTALDTANVIVPVATDAERNALTPPVTGKYAGMVVARTDVARIPLEKWDGSAWIRDAVMTSAVPVNDGFWTMYGGFIKTVHENVTQVTASLQLVRTGTGFNVTTAGTTMIVGLIPSGFRPPGNFSIVGSVLTGSDARYAEPQLIVNNGGSLVGRSVSGGDITIAVGYKLFITGTWYV